MSNLTEYETLMLKHAQIQTSMMAIQLTILTAVSEGTKPGMGNMFIEGVVAYQTHCSTLDNETCKALGTTHQC